MPKEIWRKEAQRLIEASRRSSTCWMELSEYRESHLPGAVLRSCWRGW